MLYKITILIFFIMLKVFTNEPPRKLLLFATGNCAILQQQTDSFALHKSGMKERDIVIEQFCFSDATSSKFATWKVPADKDFILILAGRDGGEKFRSYKPVSAAVIFSLIDAMPMRIQEMKKQNK
jgi:Domain of unknown function (DUF4174)